MSITPSHTLVLITGANQGLGYECVKKLAAEQPNYHIILCSRTAERGQEAAEAITDLAAGTSVEALQLDVDDDESIATAAKYVQDRYGRLDVLFNNAGIGRPPAGATPLTLRESFLKVIETNAVSAMVVTEAFVPLLKKAEVPRLLFMSSGLGSITYTLDPSWPYYGYGLNAKVQPYIASKATMNMIAALCAVQYEKDGVKVNAVDPGYRATNLNGYSEAAGKPSDGAIEACRLIVDTDRNGQHATFTSTETVHPW
ncbi:hypothetical protein A1O3_09739 [Capronia epimyces CBS 606.96]|uniref:Uncharacterized protein n=1 Tax=Capronia epimyces CBS 606.96 TaxID=1182542 RepID=W9XAL3_9EURO|nr:uncharacterized protein A1O3_09739 [Capronia epimyces CBS 606.96]EXJ77512.1 hypothetical protein A1O3_09739 [Capronia epimyces CBS 606.96]